MPIQLSERQQSTVAAAVTIVAALVIMTALAAFFWVLGSFFAAFSNVFLPLAVAGVMALVLHPYYLWLHERLRLPAALALVGVLLSIVLPLAGFGWFFGAVAVEQITDFVEQAPGLWDRLRDFVVDRYPKVREMAERYNVRERLSMAAEQHVSSILEGLQSVMGGAWTFGKGVLRVIGVTLSWAVLPVYFAFFLMMDPGHFRRLEDLLPFLKEDTRKNVLYLAREFVNILVAFFRGQLIVAFLQGVLFAAGFSLVGLRYGFVLGLTLGFLNIIPYLGSIVGLGLAIPIGLFQEGGGVWTVFWVLVVFTVVQVIEGYVLTPRIMGDRTGLHPMVIIVAVFFWGSALGGISGMLLAIPLTAFLVVFWRLVRDRYIDELV